METYLVRDWMSQNVVTIDPDASLLDACKQMHDRRIRRLPVVGREGKLVGIVTRGDSRGAWPSAVTAIVHELNLLLQSQPVAEGDRLAGLITSSDVFRMVVESHGLTAEYAVAV